MSAPEITEQIERAFDYRGYVTVTRNDGGKVVGFLYDRAPAHVEMFDETAENRIRIPLDDIADVALTGEDSAVKAQRSWERRRGQLESRETSAWGGWEDRPVMILVALPIELHGIAGVLAAKPRAGVVRGQLAGVRAIAQAIGMGGGAAHAIARERPRLVISCGFAGALDRWLRSGDLVLASSVRDDNDDVLVAPEAIRRRCREVLVHHVVVVEGELLSATRVAATHAEKQALARPGRLAVDLESWAIARAAHRAGIPWLALRAVVDPLACELPECTREVDARHTTRALRHALGGLRPALEIARLGLAAHAATRTLQRALQQLAPELARLGAPEVHG
jgi:nucleoside phosphorylase